MTTIAWDGEALAADSLCVNGHIRSGFVTKIVRGPTGELAGASGGAGFNRAFCDWILAGRAGNPPQPKEADDNRDYGFVVLLDGRIEQHEPEGVNIIAADKFAVGSGRALALGAMEAGASAEAAVKAAIVRDCYSGGEITVLTRNSNEG